MWDLWKNGHVYSVWRSFWRWTRIWSSLSFLSENGCVIDKKMHEKRFSSFLLHHLVTVRKVLVRGLISKLLSAFDSALFALSKRIEKPHCKVPFYPRKPLNTEKKIYFFLSFSTGIFYNIGGWRKRVNSFVGRIGVYRMRCSRTLSYYFFQRKCQ